MFIQISQCVAYIDGFRCKITVRQVLTSNNILSEESRIQLIIEYIFAILYSFIQRFSVYIYSQKNPLFLSFHLKYAERLETLNNFLK